MQLGSAHKSWSPGTLASHSKITVFPRYVKSQNQLEGDTLRHGTANSTLDKTQQTGHISKNSKLWKIAHQSLSSPFKTPAGFMQNTDNASSWQYLEKWHTLIKIILNSKWPKWGSSDIIKLVYFYIHLRKLSFKIITEN